MNLGLFDISVHEFNHLLKIFICRVILSLGIIRQVQRNFITPLAYSWTIPETVKNIRTRPGLQELMTLSIPTRNSLLNGCKNVMLQRFYVATSRQLKRIESVNLSPIYSHFDESVQGAATIRAYNKQQVFMQESLRRVDKHQQAYYPNVISNRSGILIPYSLVGPRNCFW